MKSSFLLLTVMFSILYATPLQLDETTLQDQSLSNQLISKPYYKIGNSYSINGKRYYPTLDKHYNKVGIASYYGPGFHNRLTANGDIFNENAITAAHPTLPMFSRVHVTNLETGKTITVTINDRGPYEKGRLIDLSKKSAELLNFKEQGTAKVKVEYDHMETERYLKQIGLYDQYKKATTKS